LTRPLAQSLSLVTSFTYTGYFVGPPLFGALAEAFGGVRWALMWNGLLLSCVGLLVGAIPEDKRPGAHAAR
jgi:MFS family permease